ncbi:2-nitropropane dioxygenase [Streptomyces sp. SID6673]|nr:2-nitropropane dioxygenase [Streptomyces sp. SID11726]NDZ94843.1 2-nitropropane dioxygenase [Streptomyces sp. SID11726]NEB23003.1 2-nitropropane dioxygenase [Streptomyces sp. SID6673]
MNEAVDGVEPIRIGSLQVPLPIMCAPMAGGPSTPALVAAVGAAGGLGWLPAGYLAPEALEDLVTDVEGRSDRPYGVNLFLSGPEPGDDRDGAVQAYVEDLGSEAARYGVAPGEPRFTDERVAEKLDVLARHRPAIISFTFGDPGAAVVSRVHRELGVPVAVTVTSVPEAVTAVASGADAVVVQGIEAGGHRGLWFDDPSEPDGGPRTTTADLVRTVVGEVDVPVIAAGGVADGATIRSLLALGAVGAQLGTAFLCCDEAGTSAPYRRALLDGIFADTVVTRSFSGRSARSLRNGFAERHPGAPARYPHVHHVTKPIRSAATAAGEADDINLWAGTSWRSVTAGPAADLVARLAAELTAGS